MVRVTSGHGGGTVSVSRREDGASEDGPSLWGIWLGRVGIINTTGRGGLTVMGPSRERVAWWVATAAEGSAGAQEC